MNARQRKLGLLAYLLRAREPVTGQELQRDFNYTVTPHHRNQVPQARGFYHDIRDLRDCGVVVDRVLEDGRALYSVDKEHYYSHVNHLRGWLGTYLRVLLRLQQQRATVGTLKREFEGSGVLIQNALTNIMLAGVPPFGPDNMIALWPNRYKEYKLTNHQGLLPE